ncbi:unnamed protein product [Paramecium octaurelia]|uniref:Uncharacterized protein n=1 Tax=Paramecium octaurelia TaxID=43137 RepID=A0A8S1WZC4_PAROT|nr:unnamed protein product [Paramecium octaurelia]
MLQSNLEWQIKVNEKNLHSSFHKINNFIDQYWIRIILPEVNEFNLVGQSIFQSNMVQELMPLINQKSQPKMQQDLNFMLIQLKAIKYQNF